MEYTSGYRFRCRTVVSAALLAFVMPSAVMALPPQELAQKVSLVSQLENVQISSDRTLLVVQGDRTQLSAPLGTDTTPERLATSAGLSLHWFGAVGVLAPARRQRLLAPPKSADVFQDLPANEATTYFLSSLTDTQWQQIQTQTGLGVASLTDTQRALAHAFIPAGQVPVAKNVLGSDEPTQQEVNLEAGNIRLGRRTSIFLQATGPGNSQNLVAFFPMPALASDVPRYEIAWKRRLPRTTLFGVPAKVEEANMPKPGDLDYSVEALQHPISLDNVRTIKDCMQRIMVATGVEIYADRRSEEKTVTVIGNTLVPAAEVLQALALACSGTYRRVDPAFVLTDDRTGFGVTYQAWKEFEKNGGEQRRELLAQTSAQFLARRSLGSLDSFGDPLALNDAQRGTHSQDTFVDTEVAQPDLTPGQWQAVSAMRDQYIAQAKRDAKKTSAQFPAPRFGGAVNLASQPTLELVVAPLDGPVDLGINFRASFPATSAPVAEQTINLRNFATRAVLARPTSTAEVDRLLAALAGAGMNQLWLAPAPVSTKDVAPAESFDALLEYAKRQSQGTTIHLFATRDILRWNADEVDIVTADRDVRGRGSLFIERGAKTALVSPFVAQVRDTNSAVLPASDSGISGQVWCAGISPGYEAPTPPLVGSAVYAPPVAYGYNPAARLAFLRAMHVDPIDLYAYQYLPVDLSVPTLEGQGANIGLFNAWQKYRWQCAYTELRSLHPGDNKPLLVEYPLGDTSWFIPWTNRAEPLDTRNPASLVLANEPVRPADQMPIFAFTLSSTTDTPDLHNLNKEGGQAWGGFVIRLERNKKTGTLPFAALQDFTKTLVEHKPASVP